MWGLIGPALLSKQNITQHVCVEARVDMGFWCTISIHLHYLLNFSALEVNWLSSSRLNDSGCMSPGWVASCASRILSWQLVFINVAKQQYWISRGIAVIPVGLTTTTTCCHCYGLPRGPSERCMRCSLWIRNGVFLFSSRLLPQNWAWEIMQENVFGIIIMS